MGSLDALRRSPELAALPSAGVAVGTLIGGRYRVLALIGEGGMAEVYEVEHAELGRHFALKVLRPRLLQESGQVERFQQEARAVARLESSHIVGIVDSGVVEGGAPFFVMELLRGSDLRRLVSRDGPLSALRAIHLALDVCRGLAVAHGAGIVHRDLKPANLFVTRDAEGKEQCKLLDFGIAKLSGNPTVPGMLVGTVRYMAPEQFDSQQAVSPATDLFALGATLFECLAGRPPFDADSFERVLFQIMNVPAPDLLGLRPDVPQALAALVMRMLAKDPRQRPTSALSLAAELNDLLAEKQTRDAFAADASLDTRPITPLSPASDTPRGASRASRSVLRALAVALSLGALAALGWAVTRRAPPAASPDPSVKRADAPPSAPRPEAVPPAEATALGTTTVAPALASSAPFRSRSFAPRKASRPASDLPLFYPRPDTR